MQLLLSSWKRSLLPGICGILAGSLYRLNVFHIRKAKVVSNLTFRNFCFFNFNFLMETWGVLVDFHLCIDWMWFRLQQWLLCFLYKPIDEWSWAGVCYNKFPTFRAVVSYAYVNLFSCLCTLCCILWGWYNYLCLQSLVSFEKSKHRGKKHVRFWTSTFLGSISAFPPLFYQIIRCHTSHLSWHVIVRNEKLAC